MAGKNPGAAFRDDHGFWYRQLFSPNVDAGFLKPADLAGDRANKAFHSQRVACAAVTRSRARHDALVHLAGGSNLKIQGKLLFIKLKIQG